MECQRCVPARLSPARKPPPTPDVIECHLFGRVTATGDSDRRWADCGHIVHVSVKRRVIVSAAESPELSVNEAALFLIRSIVFSKAVGELSWSVSQGQWACRRTIG